MNVPAGVLRCLPCDDSDSRVNRLARELDLSPTAAEQLGRSAVAATDAGFYLDSAGTRVDWHQSVQHACAAKVSLPPEFSLPSHEELNFPETIVQVRNETTLVAARRFKQDGKNPLALNFANGVQPGGGFLVGAQAQEEMLCRSSALFATLVDDPMYDFHREENPEASSDWAILSPDVPVFRTDDGAELDRPWLCSFLTCAAPYAPAVGPTQSAEMLAQRIERVLAIAKAYRYRSLVLGAWGCGAFENDPDQTARDFHKLLISTFAGAFEQITFAIVDRSRERRILHPFQSLFSAG
ncbi:MAG: TIGR02452 family protein [Rubripirellula sp.]|nr:TIGR02452 family protein [Rubripirellula sp.]